MGKKAVTNSLIFAEIRDSEGQKEPALQLLEMSCTETYLGFESLTLRQKTIDSDRNLSFSTKSTLAGG